MEFCGGTWPPCTSSGGNDAFRLESRAVGLFALGTAARKQCKSLLETVGLPCAKAHGKDPKILGKGFVVCYTR